MPVVLMQKSWRDDPKYKDAEFVVYHYPVQYFDRINSGDKFVYYRPSRGAPPDQASTYFGCGELGEVWDDPSDANHRYVAIRKSIPFAYPVPYVDKSRRMYESRFQTRDAFQGKSIRYIDDLDFHRILDAAGLTGIAFAQAPTVDDVIAGRASPLMRPPTDAFRRLDVVPEGTGYRPSPGSVPDVCEAAALQERARGDHQDTVRLLKRAVDENGGSCLYNNNVDLLANFERQQFLIEVKSLNDPSSTVDRMRYGMGQLFDYSVRYQAELKGARPVLAFGSGLRNGVAWVSEILQGNGIALITREHDTLIPVNELAKELPVFR